MVKWHLIFLNKCVVSETVFMIKHSPLLLSFSEQPWKLIVAQSQEHYEENAWKLADKQHQGTEEVW